MGFLDAALQGVGAGLQTGVATWGREKDRQLDERRLAQQADIANSNNMRALIVQELRNSGVLDQIGARGDQSVRVESVRGENAQALEDTRQSGRVDLSDKNFGHDMALTSMKEAGATNRNTTDNATRRYGIDTGASTQRRGQDISAGTQRRGQDMSAGTQQRGQDLAFTASEYGTDSANRRSLVPRPNTAMPFGGVQLPTPSYSQYFQPAPAAPTTAPPDQSPATVDPTAPVSAQPQIKTDRKPGPAVAPVPPVRQAPAVGASPMPAPVPGPVQSPAGADRVTPMPGGAPQLGQVKVFPNGRKGRWDGKGWLAVP